MIRVVSLTLFVVTARAAAQIPCEPFLPEDHLPILPPVPCECMQCPLQRIAEKRLSGDVVLRWNETTLEMIRAERTPPPVAARNLAMVHAAIYDSVAAVRQIDRPYLVRKTAPADTSIEAAAAVAAHCTLLALYPGQRARIDAALDESLEPIADGPAKLDGIQLGQAIAEEVLDWRGRDFVNAHTAYRVTNALGRWQPTYPDYKPPLLPQWVSVPTFALRSPTQIKVPPPPALTSDEFAASYREVKAIGGVNSAVRTREQTEIARFWEDGVGTATPPGHWNRIAQTVAVARRNTVAENARLFAMLNVALADAAICCWDCKYKFDFWRPVTAIRNADRLKNPALVAEADWAPLLPTPPFPAYTSGHSTFSGAAAAVLANFFDGDEMRFSSTSEGLPGKTRSFARFSDAAKEAGMSRIYGGIHWDFDNREGLEGGRKVGEYVSQNFFQPKSTAQKIDGRPSRLSFALSIR